MTQYEADRLTEIAAELYTLKVKAREATDSSDFYRHELRPAFDSLLYRLEDALAAEGK